MHLHTVRARGARRTQQGIFKYMYCKQLHASKHMSGWVKIGMSRVYPWSWLRHRRNNGQVSSSKNFIKVNWSDLKYLPQNLHSDVCCFFTRLWTNATLPQFAHLIWQCTHDNSPYEFISNIALRHFHAARTNLILSHLNALANFLLVSIAQFICLNLKAFQSIIFVASSTKYMRNIYKRVE